VIWHEMQEWDRLLVDGGLFDQPAWSWELVNLAGNVFLDAVERFRQVEEVMQDVE
jgi:hypothetical protein